MSKPVGLRRLLLTASFLTGLGLAVAVSLLLGQHTVTILVASAAGVLMFMSSAAFWLTSLTPDSQTASNPKLQVAVPQRRFLTATLAVIWIVALITAGKHMLIGVGGALNVFVVLNLISLWRLSPAERLLFEAATAQPEVDPDDLDSDLWADDEDLDGEQGDPDDRLNADDPDDDLDADDPNDARDADSDEESPAGYRNVRSD